ncbi:MAG: glycosyltransferase [Bacteroidota bacterium]
MEASLIIPFYKDISALELILTALNSQSALGSFEAIITEDDNAPETTAFLEKFTPTVNFPIIHLTHEDLAFRKCKAINEAIKVATTDYLIFIDGDCIPHQHFIRQYIKEKEEKKILYGRRVNLSESFTKKILQTKKLEMLNLFEMLISKSTRVKEALYIPFMPGIFKSKRQFWGCNWAILKKHLLEINGYDEDYTEYGFEDLDIYKRLDMMGNQLKSVKYQCIVYHLFHKTRAFNEVVNRTKEMYEKKMQEGKAKCLNGIEKL